MKKEESELVERRMQVGFTLSEVLIALLIIGVIAALTVPIVVQKWQKHSWETGKKKFLSNLIQVTGMMNQITS